MSCRPTRCGPPSRTRPLVCLPTPTRATSTYSRRSATSPSGGQRWAGLTLYLKLHLSCSKIPVGIIMLGMNHYEGISIPLITTS
eukprot:scaffold175713_cov19-Prasinocladus_malaysianus.AAC.1